MNTICKRIGLAVLGALSLFLATGCNQESKQDKIKFDTAITSKQIDRIEVVSFGEANFRTNFIIGTNVQILLSAMVKTNRTDARDTTKDQVVYWYRALEGSNEAFVVSTYESGLMSFGSYSFQPKHWPSFVTE